MEQYDAPVSQLAADVREGRTTPTELVEAFIKRIESVNPLLNAMVADRFDDARTEAAAQTAQLHGSGTDLPPLFGIPITVKEFVEVQGMPNTGGLMARKGSIASKDSPLVTRLRDAGAIVLGVTNAPEVGLWTETVNRLYGRTRNPHDLNRTPGGSSGGEAALVGCGASPLGIGTDIGGSVRLPAFCCGVFAHKATAGVIPNVGLFPSMEGETGRLHTAGPIARSVSDLTLLVDILAGHHPDDSLSTAGIEPAVVHRPEDAHVLVVESPGRPRVTGPVKKAIRQSAAALAARGIPVRGWSHPGLARGFDLWSAAMEEASGDASFQDVLGDGGPISPWAEAVKLLFGQSNHTTPAVVLLLLEGAMARLPVSRRRRLLATLSELRQRLEDALGPNGVLLYPSYTRTAPRHRRMMLRPFDFACTGLFNALELPVTQVPTGRATDGMPLGVQVVGATGRDRTTLTVASWLEQDLGGWVRPTPQRYASLRGE
ncbi:MAG: fatty acid amide hydrolase 2 [Myxococcota bacterium]|jgi:fatty acid amide hydrolase 2